MKIRPMQSTSHSTDLRVSFATRGPRLLSLMLLVLLMVDTAASQRQDRAVPSEIAPDLVLLDGNVVTMDDSNSIAQGVAIKGDRIVAVGTTSEIGKLVGKRTRV